MNDYFQDSVFFGAAVSLLAYGLGAVLNKKTKLAILNPLLISIVATILVITLGHIDYDTYN